MKIGDFDTKSKVMVIAEIGNNHEGNFEFARKMVISAADAGADAVKFQTIRAEKLYSPADFTRVARLKGFELSNEEFTALSEVAAEKSVIFLSTPFDLESAEFLNGLVPAFKVASGDNNFIPLLDKLVSFGKPIILSTGLSDMSSLREVFDHLLGMGGEMALLHCSCSYPVPDDEVNLNAIRAMRDAFGCEVGYSDHSIGIDAPIMSVAIGARIVEKHFTMDNDFSDFRDHKLSANPEDFRKMVDGIRKVERMLGNGIKAPVASEGSNLIAARRSIRVVRDLDKGAVLKMESLAWLRPGNGIPPGREKEIIGRRLKRSLRAGEEIMWSDLES